LGEEWGFSSCWRCESLLDKGVIRVAGVNMGDLGKRRINQRHSAQKERGESEQKFARIRKNVHFLTSFFRPLRI
jgi:hypothetical protein